MRHKATCSVHRTEVHPLYFRDSRGKFVRLEGLFFCSRTPSSLHIVSELALTRQPRHS